MNKVTVSGYTLIAAALLAACGGSQPPIAPGTMAQRHTGERSSPQNANRYKVIYNFGTPSGSCADGVMPDAGLVLLKGSLYGTTFGGGTYDGGTVFSMSTHGAEKLVYSFHAYAGGYGPRGVTVVNDRLYGVLSKGGTYGGGVLYRMETDGKERLLHYFGNGSDGSYPLATPIAVDGTLYGTTSAGGLYGHGTIFSVDTNTGQERVLHSFSGQPDGREPDADLTAVNGTLYGTTAYGGANDFGSVFSVNAASGTEQPIYSFKNSPDGLDPEAGLLAVNGTLYGTTAWGGAYSAGTVFSVKLDGSNERVLHSFSNTPDGEDPRADLIKVGRTLYGTTTQGGEYASGSGTLFSVKPTTGREVVLHSFGNGSDGANPIAPMLAVRHALYGTTFVGGPNFSWCMTSGGNYLGTFFKWRL